MSKKRVIKAKFQPCEKYGTIWIIDGENTELLTFTDYSEYEKCLKYLEKQEKTNDNTYNY